MDGSDPPTPPKAVVTRAFEATRLADELMATACDRLLAAIDSARTAKPASCPRVRRTAEAAPTPIGGRGR